MRYFEIINEGRDAPLFHATSFGNAISILEDDCIKARQDRPQLINGKSVLGVSLTRSWTIASNWARVIFELNQSLLATQYRIVPFSINGTHLSDRPSSVYHHDPTNPFSTKRLNGERDRRNEYEEFCFGSIKPLSRYLIKVHILQDDPKAQVIRSFCQDHNIAFTNYDDKNPSNTLLPKIK